VPNEGKWSADLTSRIDSASDFIGHQTELAVLNAALDDAVAGRGRIVMLAGKAGIGKTRLAQERLPAYPNNVALASSGVGVTSGRARRSIGHGSN